jgi:GTP-binding protein EngB required for normal cell division
MNKTINQFELSKEKAHQVLTKLQAFLSLGEQAGAEIEANLKDKLHAALREVDGGKLKIALIGGFSEGKTSIAAAWMEKIDVETMNISHQESSDVVKLFELSDDCILIDTPGLFGFKEKFDADTEQVEKYKEITKKYVSEAHLVLYVMNPTNPIKASHQDELKWLFRTLNLLSRTVFVLSRFDEVADVEDEWDYQENVTIKKQNMTERLKDSIELTNEESAELAIVAVAANPFDMGISYWLENKEKFKALSHIDKLQSVTADKVRVNGGQMAIALEAKNSIIRDVLNRQLPKAIDNDEKIGIELSRLQEMNARLDKQCESASAQILDVKISLRTFAAEYFSDLIMQVKGTDMQTFADFFEREVGESGVMIDTRINNEFERQTSALSLRLSQIKSNFASEVNHYNSAVKLLGKQGLNYVVKGKFINNQSILVARDGIAAAAKAIGVDLGHLLKFKPWGAVNLAKGLNGALVFVGVAFEAWDSWTESKREEEFAKSKGEMIKSFEEQRREILSVINGDEFTSTFFPDHATLDSSLNELNQCIGELAIRRDKFAQWREQGEIIEAEFSVV